MRGEAEPAKEPATGTMRNLLHNDHVKADISKTLKKLTLTKHRDGGAVTDSPLQSTSSSAHTYRRHSMQTLPGNATVNPPHRPLVPPRRISAMPLSTASLPAEATAAVSSQADAQHSASSECTIQV